MTAPRRSPTAAFPSKAAPSPSSIWSRSLFKAFERAKDLAIARLLEENEPMATYPWIDGVVAEARATMGRDFWPYGVEENRKTLEAFLRYYFRQGLAERQLAVEEMFAPSTLVRSRL